MRRECREQLPERQSLTFGVQIPDGVHHGADAHVHDALFGTQPSQLAVVGEATPERTHVGEDVGDAKSDDERLDRANRGHCNLVAASDREDESVTGVALGGVDDHVGRRIVRVLIHRVTAVALARRRKAHVEHLEVREGLGSRAHSALALPPMTRAMTSARRMTSPSIASIQ